MKNKSKQIKKILSILLICILLIVIIKIITTKVQKNVEVDNIEIVDGSLDFDLNKVEKVKSRSDYCLVKKCVEKFYNYYTNNKDVFNLLDEEYINSFNIKENEIQGKYGDFEKVKLDIIRNVLF